MKDGGRVLGVAESYSGDESTLAGVVMTAAGRIEGVCFGQCTVGGTDATDAIVDLVERIDREDIRAVMLAGVALAWYNIVDLEALTASVGRPVVAVTFESSDGLEVAIESAFDGEQRTDRLERYRSLPPRHAVAVGDHTMYVRAAGCTVEHADGLVVATTPTAAARPEPLRVANLAARAADEVIA